MMVTVAFFAPLFLIPSQREDTLICNNVMGRENNQEKRTMIGIAAPTAACFGIIINLL